MMQKFWYAGVSDWRGFYLILMFVSYSWKLSKCLYIYAVGWISAQFEEGGENLNSGLDDLRLFCNFLSCLKARKRKKDITISFKNLTTWKFCVREKILGISIDFEWSLSYKFLKLYLTVLSDPVKRREYNETGMMHVYDYNLIVRRYPSPLNDFIPFS